MALNSVRKATRMPFEPKFTLTARIATDLMRIEGAKQAVVHLPITAAVVSNLWEIARLYSTHYSTLIEGNRLTQEQVSKVIGQQEHFPGRERDEREVLGYYAAFERVELLDPRQRKVLGLFRDRDTITSHEVELLFTQPHAVAFKVERSVLA